MKFFALVIFLFLFQFDVKSNEILKKTFNDVVPYIYKHDGNEVELFISFRCKFCKESFEQLIAYLKKRPKAKVKIHYFCANKEDRKKVLYLLAAGNNFNDLLSLAKILLPLYEKDFEKNEKFKLFLKNKPYILTEMKKNIVQFNVYVSKMQKRVLEAKIDRTPSWLLNDIILIEGMVDSLETTINDLAIAF